LSLLSLPCRSWSPNYSVLVRIRVWLETFTKNCKRFVV
jgi:hypothetical protein